MLHATNLLESQHPSMPLEGDFLPKQMSLDNSCKAAFSSRTVIALAHNYLQPQLLARHMVLALQKLQPATRMQFSAAQQLRRWMPGTFNWAFSQGRATPDSRLT